MSTEHNIKNQIAQTYLNIGELLLEQKQNKKAIENFQTCLEIANQIDDRILTRKVYRNLSQTYASMGKFEKDDFDRFILPKLRNPVPDGLIIGSPVYFRNISSLCMAFLERLAVLRKPKLLLANTPVGALSVGAYRNGGQELAIQQIQTALLCHEVMVVGGKPGAHQGATLWNAYNDDITKDEFGIATAKNLGRRVAEIALQLTSKK